MKSLEAFSKNLKEFETFFDYPNDHIKFVRRFLPNSKVFIFSPHPDDEIISGGAAIRLLQENQCPIHNLAITLGSNASRKLPRRRELAQATKFLKWNNTVLPEKWSEKERKAVQLIKKDSPKLIIAPHAEDHHPTHIKTAQLTVKVLRKARATTTVLWAEYWCPQRKPNVLIGYSHELVIKQVKALHFHKGEIARNPYHLLLPAWHIDSVRRGSEWIRGKGAAGSPFVYGQIYRLEKWVNGKPLRNSILPTIMGPNSDLSDLLF